MIERYNDYDWKEAFVFADGFSIEDVVEIYADSEGSNDQESWLSFGRLKDGRYYFLTAWCDYTGWDCQSGGDSYTAPSREEVELMGMSDAERSRLGIATPLVPEHSPIPDIE